LNIDPTPRWGTAPALQFDDLIMRIGNEMGHVAGTLSAGLRRAS
jgi:hypothetical protein